MNLIVPHIKQQKSNKTSEKEKKRNLIETQSITNLNDHEYDINDDDKTSSIIIKKSQKMVMDSLLKKGNSNIPSELWLG